MTGVPRSVAEHRLSVREGYPPVRQKKRGQAPERTKAIQAEVEKLVEAEIMREVYYHDWLSNPSCQIGRNIEVYIDDLVIKSHTEAEMLRDVVETFRTLRKIYMKLNPKKCTFGAVKGMFLGYMVTPKGIRPCPDKTTVVQQLPSSRTIKEKCIKKSDFHWTSEAEQAIKQLKQHLSKLRLLVAPKPKEELIVYLFASYGAISAVLMTKRGAVQTPVYFVSHALQGPELNYTLMKKLVEITFPPLTTSSGAEGPLVIEEEIGGHMIHRMYVDGGSSMEILNEHCFNRLRPEVRNQMVPATTSLTGFSRETIWPLGQLRLLVTIGDADHSTRAWMNFMIVRSVLPYNGIIRRPGIKEIQAVPSIAHGMLKFPLDGGIVTIRSTVVIPAECAMVITSSVVPKEVAGAETYLPRPPKFLLVSLVNNPELTKRLNGHVPNTMEEIMITIAAFIRGEAAVASKEKGHTSWRTHDQSKRKTSEK
nr:reverse transcriptase domain-containing protein [Tanacetum cinerariifolium]